MINTCTKLADLGLQSCNALLEVRFWSWGLGDKPANAMSGRGQPPSLQFAECVAHGHLSNIVLTGQLAGGRKPITNLLLATGDLFQEVIEHPLVRLGGAISIGHVTTVHQLT